MTRGEVPSVALDSMGLEHPMAALMGLAPLSLTLLTFLRARGERSRLLKLMGGRVSRLVLVIEVARALGLAALILSAGGLYTVETVLIEAENATVEQLGRVKALHVLILDDSRSMAYEGGGRLDTALKVARGYVESLGEGDSIVVYRLHSRVEEVCRGTPVECLAALDSFRAGERFTALGTALAQVEATARATGLPVIGVIISDGAHNYGPDPLQVAREMESVGALALIRVGNDPRGVVMEALAGMKGWYYYHADAGLPPGVAQDLASQAYRDAKVRAVADVNGMIPVETRDYTPSLIAALVGGLLIALSMVVGP